MGKGGGWCRGSGAGSCRPAGSRPEGTAEAAGRQAPWKKSASSVQALLTRVLRTPGLDGRTRVLKPYHASDILTLDEFGYLPADADIGPILYEVIATRYERKATIISNKSLTEWGGSCTTARSRPPSSIACSTTASSTTSRATATGAAASRKPRHPIPRTWPRRGNRVIATPLEIMAL